MRGKERSNSVRVPPRQRTVRWASRSMRSTVTITSSRRVRSSSLRSRSVVVGAAQTLCRSEPRERIFFFSSSLSTRGRCRSRRSSSASAAARSRKRLSHSVSVRVPLLPPRFSIHRATEVFLPRFDSALINAHEHLVVSIGGVLGQELSAACLSDLFHISRMSPNPFHLAAQVLGTTRNKMYPGAFVCNHLLEGSESRYDGWRAAGVGLRDRHREILIALARYNQESCTLHCRKNRLPVEVTQKLDASKPQSLDQSFEITAQGAIPHDPQRNLAPELLPSGEQGSQSFFSGEATHEQGVVGNVALGAWIGMNKIGLDDNFCRRQSARDELVSGKIR